MNRTEKRRAAHHSRTKPPADVKQHLPGVHVCEARATWNTFRDAPDARRRVLLAAMRTQKVTPCDAHELLNSRPGMKKEEE